MSGQFEQRRLGRPSFQLDVLDAFCGAAQLERGAAAALAWRELVAARRRYEELTRDADAVAARLAELQALVEATEGMAAGRGGGAARAGASGCGTSRSSRRRRPPQRRRSRPTRARAPLRSRRGAERALAPLERIAPELAPVAEELRDLAVRLGEVGSDLHRFVASLDAEPGALEDVEERLQAIADLKRRFAAASYDELLELAAAAERELGERRTAAIRSRRPQRGGRSCEARDERARGRAPCRTRDRARDRFGEAVRAELALARAWGRASSSSSSASASSARRGRRGDVPHPAERRASRSRRSPRPRRAASSRASLSRSRPSRAGRRSSSTRSTPASAA